MNMLTVQGGRHRDGIGRYSYRAPSGLFSLCGRTRREPFSYKRAVRIRPPLDAFLKVECKKMTLFFFFVRKGDTDGD